LIANKLGVGAKIECVLSGEVIPKHTKTLEPVMPQILSHCLSCNTDTTLIGDHLSCPNPLCDQTLVSAMFHGFKRLGVDLFGRKACEKLIQHNFKSVCEVIILTHSEFVSCGFGQKQASNFIQEIKRAISEPLADTNILSSLGVKHLGRGASKKVLSLYNISDVLSLTEKDICAMDGLGALTARDIVDELMVKGSTLTFLLDLGFNITHSKQSNKAVTQSALTGLTVVFTGTMLTGSRAELEVNAVSHGAKVGAKITKNTDILIIGERVGASKTSKAKELNTKVLTEAEYLELYF